MTTRLQFVKYRLCLAAAVAILIFGLGSTAHAGVLVGGWDYAIDSLTDGSGSAEGFDYSGLAFRQIGSVDYFALSSGVPLNGIAWGGTLNNNVGHGDLILNFSSHNLSTPADFTDPNVFAVRFDSTNDSLNNVNGSNSTIGLFGSITPVSLTTQNDGYATLQQYYDAGFNPNYHDMADLSTSTDVINYFGDGVQYPNISSGTLLGGITLLDRTDLTNLGLNFGQFGADPAGNNVFGFSLDANLLPSGNFTASQFLECINDGMALFGTNAVVPEPGTMSLAVVGLLGLCGWKRYRGRRATARQT